ncbi:MAG: dynamin family protein [Micromonosporaceae bacterium]|nr:dynamin family protein [Micromonosporaceae bacterium]
MTRTCQLAGNQQNDAVSAPPWLDLLDETIRVCGTRGRPDLAERLRQRRTRLLEGTLRVLVVGAPRHGKSQLINALVNAPVCAVGDGVTTLIPTVIRYGATPAAEMVAASTGERVPMPVEQVAASVGGRVGAPGRPAYVRAEVAIPRQLLAPGLVLVDTPGIDDPGSPRARPAFAALGQADAALVVAEATHEPTASELDLLRRVASACPTMTLVLTKTDLAPDWRQVLARTRDRLARAGLPVRVVAVSAALRQRAARAGALGQLAQESGQAAQLNAESGFPDLVRHLQRDLVGQVEVLAGRTVAAATRAALAELAAPLRAELSARGSARAGEPELQLAQRRLNALRRRSTRWQNVLSDEIADLVADVEYDLRDRTRTILRRVDEIFDTADPLQVWDSFAEWLEENLSLAAERNFAWLIERAEWIAKAIAVHFPPDQPGIYPESTFEVPRDLFDAVTRPPQPAFERFTPTQKIHSGLRGSYGGVLMAGLITSLAGMPVINAISLGVGGLFGTRSLRDESQARLKRRQAAAKAAAQRHVDDFFLKFGKDSKDIARRVQRRLRDHFSAVTEELQESILSSARAARQAVDRDAAELSRDLEQLDALQRQAQALAGRGALAVA